MPAMPPDQAPEPPAVVSGVAMEPQRQARYNYLVGRLRSRQITMEEATELFAAMQAMLRASETSRRASLPPPPPQARGPVPVVGPPQPRAPSGGSDDLFLVGLLAMGAGAGLLAAMSRRLAEGPRDPAPVRGANPRRDA